MQKFETNEDILISLDKNNLVQFIDRELQTLDQVQLNDNYQTFCLNKKLDTLYLVSDNALLLYNYTNKTVNQQINNKIKKLLWFIFYQFQYLH